MNCMSRMLHIVGLMVHCKLKFSAIASTLQSGSNRYFHYGKTGSNPHILHCFSNMITCNKLPKCIFWLYSWFVLNLPRLLECFHDCALWSSMNRTYVNWKVEGQHQHMSFKYFITYLIPTIVAVHLYLCILVYIS